MKAVVCKEFGPPESLVVEEVPEPKAGPGQVVIDVHACGLNFPDVLIIQDKYQFKPKLPFTPGGEVAGIVSEVGPDVDNVAVGDAVIAGASHGGLAERVVASATGVTPIPKGVDMAEASGFMTTYGTGYYGLVARGGLQAGESLLVLGAAGGVGLAAVDIGRALGARVIAAASSEEKLDLCRRFGAAETINYAEEDLKERAKALTGGAGVDVIYDPVGGAYAEPALRAIAWEGRFLVIGFAAGDIPRIPLNLTLLKSCQIVGVFYGAYSARDPVGHKALVGDLMKLWQDGPLHPYVSATYPFDQAAQGIRDLADRKALGKLVVLTPAGQAAAAASAGAK